MRYLKNLAALAERELRVYAYAVAQAISLNATGIVSWSVAKSALYAGIAPAFSAAEKALAAISASADVPASAGSQDA